MVFAAGTMSILSRPAIISSTTNFTYSGSIQTWTAPAYGTVTCTLRGAAGGSNIIPSYSIDIRGGNGASLTFSFPVKGNEVYNILIGQKPATNTTNSFDSTNGGGPGGGGGGASAITLETTIIAVAGGGGGAGYSFNGGASAGTSSTIISSPDGIVYSGNAGLSPGVTTTGGRGGYTTGGAAAIGRASTSVKATAGSSTGGNGAYFTDAANTIKIGGNGYIVSANNYNISGGSGNMSPDDGCGGGGGGGWFGGGGGAIDGDGGKGTGGGAGSSFISSICTTKIHSGGTNVGTGSASIVFTSF